MWEWSADVLGDLCDSVVFAVPAGYEEGEGPWRVRGGESRSESVSFALDVVPDADIVVVQDAARPLVTRELVERCIAQVQDGWDGAIAAAPVTDTIKETDGHGRVVRTLDRSALWSIQTPQAFRAAVLRRALEAEPHVLAGATDDASLVEGAGGSVRVVDAPRENLKVTVPADLRLAEQLLSERC
jgi:2-C-methyl-D-erythritol 4-phosphate cytidylyltransferase